MISLFKSYLLSLISQNSQSSDQMPVLSREQAILRVEADIERIIARKTKDSIKTCGDENLEFCDWRFHGAVRDPSFDYFSVPDKCFSSYFAYSANAVVESVMFIQNTS